MEIISQSLAYPAYFAEPTAAGKMPAIVLIHSFNGLEPGYKNLTDNLAKEGYIVLSPEWQTFNKTPADEVVEGVIRDSVAYLKAKPNVDVNRLGLTGFCAGGRYTMLLLPQMPQFRSGVAWYSFPYSGGFANQYATALNATGKYFELKVYQGKPHGFMIENGSLSRSFEARDAFNEMVSFFNRTLTK